MSLLRKSETTTVFYTGLKVWEHELLPFLGEPIYEKGDVKFYTITHVHGTHIADKNFFFFAYRNGELIGTMNSDPWENVESNKQRFFDKF